MTDLSDILSRLGYTQPQGELTAEEKKKQSYDVAYRIVKDYNNKQGNLNEKDNYNCNLCHNKGDSLVLTEHDTYYSYAYRPCKCMQTRSMINKIKKSGLSGVFRNYTLNTYIPKEKWQENAKIKATEYINNPNGNWFYMGGAVGTGKTHLCSAIAIMFLKKNIAVRYMLWRDEVVHLKANITNGEEYERSINELKKAPVLYIDDFFKTAITDSGTKTRPTAAEISIAYEIINYRYMNKELLTIISSEYTIEQLMMIDEATASRIFDKSKINGFCIGLGNECENYRLRQ